MLLQENRNTRKIFVVLSAEQNLFRLVWDDCFLKIMAYISISVLRIINFRQILTFFNII